VLTDVGTIGPSLRKHGVDVLALNMKSVADVPAALWKLRQIIKERDPDIVQTWMYHADLMGGIAARLAGHRRIIWGIRTTDIMKGTARSTAYVRRICAALSSRIPWAIVCVANAARDAHVAIGYDRSRIVIIPNGFDVESFRPRPDARTEIRAQFGWTENEIVIGCVARFNHYKDQGNFVRAAGEVAERCSNVRFLMVGAGVDTSNEELMGWIRDTRHADRFGLLGERNDVPLCLAAMDVYCLPSRSEAFPNVVGEAMASRLPCVVTNVGDTAMLVGDTGLVVPKEDSRLLAEALTRLVTMTAEERAAIGMRAHARISETFSLASARRRFEELYLASRVTNADDAVMKLARLSSALTS
jgi:glycosyltransferase involved in cell wall biosynthesis